MSPLEALGQVQQLAAPCAHGEIAWTAVISENGDQVFLQLHEPITTYLLPFLTVEMFLQVILEIKKTEHGLVISRQEVRNAGTLLASSRPSGLMQFEKLQDHILWAETFVHQLPIFGSFYINYVRRWVGLAIVYLMYAVKFVTTSFDYCFAQTSTQVGLTCVKINEIEPHLSMSNHARICLADHSNMSIGTC